MSRPLFSRGTWSTLLLTLVLTLATTARGESVTYFIPDPITGSPIAATDEQGNVLWVEAHLPYGVRIGNGADVTDHPLQYLGKPEDPDTGLLYLGARYYDPAIGRFLAPDPIGFVAECREPAELQPLRLRQQQSLQVRRSGRGIPRPASDHRRGGPARCLRQRQRSGAERYGKLR